MSLKPNLTAIRRRVVDSALMKMKRRGRALTLTGVRRRSVVESALKMKRRDRALTLTARSRSSAKRSRRLLSIGQRARIGLL